MRMRKKDEVIARIRASSVKDEVDRKMKWTVMCPTEVDRFGSLDGGMKSACVQ